MHSLWEQIIAEKQKQNENKKEEKKKTLCKGIKGNFSLGLDANNDEGESVVMRPRWVATKAVCEGAEGRKGGSFSSGQMCCGADLVASGLAHMEELELESASS